ncbi:MAG TPA: sensor histidine kinase, partial [Aggregatilineales bacterium]|nr:sensor histidine kinase [Aggregatilineales bacterium]
RFADHTSLAIENARLYEQAKEVAAAGERNRLARELHDAVTQTLFSTSLIAEVLPVLWERNRPEAEKRLQEIRQLTRGALAEMRTLLLELRPTSLVEVPLPDLLRQLTEALSARGRVDITLDVTVVEPPPRDVKMALYRTTQEALNNVLKHAQATQVHVAGRCEAERVELSIRDDGRGFDFESIPPDHLGLSIMRERADAIGARLSIDSAVGEGTEVRVCWQA